jgi:hypothetical protein
MMETELLSRGAVQGREDQGGEAEPGFVRERRSSGA